MRHRTSVKEAPSAAAAVPAALPRRNVEARGSHVDGPPVELRDGRCQQVWSNNTVTQVTSRAMLFPPIVRWEHRIATTYSTMSNTAQAIWKDGSDHVLAARPTADASEGRPDTCAGPTRKAVHPQLEVLSSC